MSTMVTGEAAARTADEPATPPAPRRRQLLSVAAERISRHRLVAVCLGFVVLAMLQQPGRIIGDTKLDLAVAPLDFLARALTLWEPQGGAGQLQNQAYGYFFPMGPFFALGDVIGLPMWIVQRLWLAALMSVAFVGVVILARRLGIGTPASALVAGVAYALAPRMVSVLGAASIEVVPMALAPWVIIPLAGAARHGSARRAAAFSGVAVFCVGGVNAVATAAVLPLAVLFLLTRPAGPFRRRLMAWWVVSVGLATAWWLGPLVLLGRYSAPFLYYIETAQTTTGPTDFVSVLRGTTHWVASLPSSAGGPIWPAGWSLLNDVVPAAATIVVAALGMLALCRRDLPERTWLVLGLLAGVGLVSLGHLATVQGLWADPLHDALDGALAPLRNVHKFDPVLRLPLALGLAHLLAVLFAWAAKRRDAPPGGSRRARLGRLVPHAIIAVIAFALVSTFSPALAGKLTSPTGFTDVPGYWQETADFLAGEQPSGRALLVPGSSFGSYEWGSPNDEPMQPLAESPWDVRNAIPLSPEGHIRMLDAVEERLARGEGSPGLARYLTRAGISHLVLRNDLDTRAAQATRAVLVREALAESPGITRTATFGPVVSIERTEDGEVFDAGLDEPAPAIEVYSVEGEFPRASTYPLSSAVTVHGGPEAVLALEDRGLITDRPALMAGSTDIQTSLVMVTDALVRRERNFGRLVGPTSAGMTPDQPLTMDAPARDYVLPHLNEAESAVEYVGGTPRASSSAADPDGFSGSRLDTTPWAAVDGNVLTAWRPAPWIADSEAPWWELTTDRMFLASEVAVSLAKEPGAPRVSELRLTTDAGEITVPVADTDEEQFLPLPEGYTRTLRISSTVPSETEDGPLFLLSDVRIPGVGISRTTVTPPPARSADVYAFDAESGRAGCVVVTDGATRCAAGLVSGAEETRFVDRTFTTSSWLKIDVFATAVARPGPALDLLLTQTRGSVPVAASSAQVLDPRGSAIAAVDGDPGTAWVAEGDDRRPTLTLTWPEERPISSLRVVTPAGASVVPTAVTVDGAGTSETAELAADGTATFPEIVTNQLQVAFELPEEVEYLDPYTGWTPPLGLAVSELEVGEPNPAVDPAATVDLACGTGPTVQVDGAVLQTSARTTVAALQNLQPVPLRVCTVDDPSAEVTPFDIPAGVHRVLGDSSELMTPDSITLTDSVPVPRVEGLPSVEPGIREAPEVVRWDPENRTLRVAERAEPTLLVVPENTNDAWTARLDGEFLDRVTVDGWQQGYVLPAGAAGEVQLDFKPGDYYRTALGIGAGAVLLLALVAATPGRPSRTTPRRPRPRWLTRTSAVVAAVALVGAAAFGTALALGVVGLVSLAALWVVAQVAGRRRAAVLGGIAALALLTAGTISLIELEGTETVRQTLAIVAVGAVVAGILPALRFPFRRTPA
jgi:arabinofuranan 3-O-arabinosyltransferase